MDNIKFWLSDSLLIPGWFSLGGEGDAPVAVVCRDFIGKSGDVCRFESSREVKQLLERRVETFWLSTGAMPVAPSQQSSLIIEGVLSFKSTSEENLQKKKKKKRIEIARKNSLLPTSVLKLILKSKIFFILFILLNYYQLLAEGSDVAQEPILERIRTTTLFGK